MCTTQTSQAVAELEPRAATLSFSTKD
ncbi:MAG: hypothetical protein ACRCUJ_11160 [Phocaeicola sp.]